MRPTVDTAVSDRPVSTGKADILERWVNREAVPAIARARKALNARGLERPEPQVSDAAGTYLVIWISPELPADCAWTLEAHVAGFSATSRANYKVTQAFQSVSSTIAATSALGFDFLYESAAACDVRFTVDAANRIITLDARDDAVAAMQWTCVVQTHEGLPVQT